MALTSRKGSMGQARARVGSLVPMELFPTPPGRDIRVRFSPQEWINYLPTDAIE